MSVDPFEEDLPDEIPVDGAHDDDTIDIVETSTEWSGFRNQMALDMFNEWRSSRGHAT